MCLMHYQAYSFPCTHIGGAPMINLLSHGYLIYHIFDAMFQPHCHQCTKKGEIESASGTCTMFCVMTMWLVELISVAKVYPRIFVPSAS